MAVSPDGRHVYATAGQSDAVAAFARNTVTGVLTQLAGTAGCVSQDGTGGPGTPASQCAQGKALDGAQGVAVSPDGVSAYVTSATSRAVAVFNRDSGELKQLAGSAGCISQISPGEQCAQGRALASAQDVVVSPDGRNVYAAAFTSSSVAALARETVGPTPDPMPVPVPVPVPVPAVPDPVPSLGTDTGGPTPGPTSGTGTATGTGTVVPLDQLRGAPAKSPCAKGPGPRFVVLGTNRTNKITGTNSADRIISLGGKDEVSGGRGNDCLDGGSGPDRLDGSLGSDRIYGQAGSDSLLLGAGNDKGYGGAARDRITTGRGTDFVWSGTGDDIINAASNGPPARVNCGSGFDKTRVNRNERKRTRDCERVYVTR